MRRCLLKLKVFVEHPLTHLVVGLVLIATAAMDIYSDLQSEEHRYRIGAHHGIIVLGIVQVLAALPPIVQGIQHWIWATEVAKQKPGEE